MRIIDDQKKLKTGMGRPLNIEGLEDFKEGFRALMPKNIRYGFRLTPGLVIVTGQDWQ